MTRRVAIIGAGLGGLTAALRLAQLGYDVNVYEARSAAGGLASSRVINGIEFDGGPYVLLDRPGLEWTFGQLGLQLDELVPMQRIEAVYQVQADGEPTVRIDGSLESTVDQLESTWPGSGAPYRKFIGDAWAAYQRLQPLQQIDRPAVRNLLATGAWRSAGYLLRSLDSVLQRTGLPMPIRNAIGIWTHVAGHRMTTAPAPLAFVPALIHHIGAWYPVGGIGRIVTVLTAAAESAGAQFHYGSKVTAIRCRGNRATGIELAGEEFIEANAVVANAHGVGAYLRLLPTLSTSGRKRLQQLPLQSPGVCAYLAASGETPGPYLRFRLPADDGLCRLLIVPGALSGNSTTPSLHAARLMAPMEHAVAEAGGRAGQQQYLDRLLAESWWQTHLRQWQLMGSRLPADWGAEFSLYRDSMNPVMTPRFMRAGRLAHRSPYAAGLYLAGSSTHPGQWVSFCAISGILAAERLREDA